MAKLADALDLGSSAARRGGSSPLFRTKFLMKFVGTSFFISFYLDKRDYTNTFNGIVLHSRIIVNMMLNYIISYKYRYAYETRWSSNCTVTVLICVFIYKKEDYFVKSSNACTLFLFCSSFCVLVYMMSSLLQFYFFFLFYTDSFALFDDISFLYFVT